MPQPNVLDFISGQNSNVNVSQNNKPAPAQNDIMGSIMGNQNAQNQQQTLVATTSGLATSNFMPDNQANNNQQQQQQQIQASGLT